MPVKVARGATRGSQRTQTAQDRPRPHRTSAQVNGSPPDSPRPSPTPHTWLGVKGSRVPPARRQAWPTDRPEGNRLPG